MEHCNTTFCIGYWHIELNTKHHIDHYLKLIPKTLELIGNNNLVLFYENDDILKLFKKYKKTNKFLPIKIYINDLPTYEMSKDYLESCKKQNNEYLQSINNIKEKGLIHYDREYMQSGEDSFRKIFSVWSSKILLIQKIIKKKPF
jgi:hypothetical protein